MNLRKQIVKIIVICLILGLPEKLYGESLTSPNYRLENPEFDAGGGLSTSTNYRSQDSLGGTGQTNSSSSNYKINPGFPAESYPGVPGQPTITNTGGGMYNTLDFIIATGGNRSDVNYAIAISTDNFASVTNFVQADDSIGTSTVWQTYTDWGGASGERLVTLTYNTTYTIKVKARYGPDSETGYSLTAAASTSVPTLSVVIAGINSGTSIAGQTTNVTTSATSVNFSTLQSGQIKVGAQQVTVTTNANGGYLTSLYQDSDLKKSNGTIIPEVPGTNASPLGWPTGITSAAFGYHSTDATLCTGISNRFSANDTYAAATSTPAEVACNTGPANNDTNSLVYKVEVGSRQAQGYYSNKIIYITTASY